MNATCHSGPRTSPYLCREYIFAFFSRTSWDFSELFSLLSILQPGGLEQLLVFLFRDAAGVAGWGSTGPGPGFSLDAGESRSVCWEMLRTAQRSFHRDAEDAEGGHAHTHGVSSEGECFVEPRRRSDKRREQHCSCCCGRSNLTAASSKEADQLQQQQPEREEPQQNVAQITRLNANEQQKFVYYFRSKFKYTVNHYLPQALIILSCTLLENYWNK